MSNIKVCEACGRTKLKKEFRKNKHKIGGYENICKICHKIKCEELRNNSKPLIIKKSKDEIIANRKETRKRWRDANKKIISQKRKDYREANKEKVLQQKRITLRNHYARSKGYIDHDDFIRRTTKIKNIFNYGPEFLKAYRDYHKEQKRIADNEKIKIKRQTDLQFRLMDNLRARTRKILKIQSANKHTNMAKLIGCSGKELADRFISMGYNPDTDNIDHIIPISKFNLSIPEHQFVSCHYLNLQPLNSFHNMSKSDLLPDRWETKIIQICEVRGINPIPIIKHFIKGITCQLLV